LAHTPTCDTVAGRLIGDLRLPQVGKRGKIDHFPEFGHDHVARGSEGALVCQCRAQGRTLGAAGYC